MENFFEIFYKIIENPRCIKYYEDLISFYEKKQEKDKSKIYKKVIEKIKNDSILHSDKK